MNLWVCHCIQEGINISEWWNNYDNTLGTSFQNLFYLLSISSLFEERIRPAFRDVFSHLLQCDKSL